MDVKHGQSMNKQMGLVRLGQNAQIRKGMNQNVLVLSLAETEGPSDFTR